MTFFEKHPKPWQATFLQPSKNSFKRNVSFSVLISLRRILGYLKSCSSYFRPACHCANLKLHFKIINNKLQFCFKNIYFRVLLTASKCRYFVWTEDHDVLMLCEAVTSEPYNFKPKSTEREGKYGKASQPIWIIWRLQNSGLQQGQWEIDMHSWSPGTN